jgi:OmcA/MtrC family decaheme c-type cytochrome
LDKTTGETKQRLAVNTTVLGCVGSAPGSFRGEAGTDHTEWMTHPSRAACGACHDDVDFDTGDNHEGGAQGGDSQCSVCHVPDSGREFDQSVRGAHTPLFKTAQFPGVLVKILEVTNAGPGKKPTVKFSLGSKNGRVSPASLNRFLLTLTGPNDDFSFYAQEDASGASASGDDWTYTFDTPLPANAKGSYSIGFEGRETVAVTQHDDAVSNQNNPAQNATFAFAVTDATAVPRRMLVDDYNCEGCHDNLTLHGNNRNNPQYCVTCHRPDATDEVVRPDGTGAPQSIHFKYMVHKIHSGAELENGYFVYGYRSAEHDYGHVEYPGDLRNCEKCHVNDSYELPLPKGVLATTTPRDWWTPTEPIAAACLSCHDDDSTTIHADANTTFFGESCSTCHGEGKDFAVSKAHAR